MIGSKNTVRVRALNTGIYVFLVTFGMFAGYALLEVLP